MRLGVTVPVIEYRIGVRNRQYESRGSSSDLPNGDGIVGVTELV